MVVWSKKALLRLSILKQRIQEAEKQSAILSDKLVQDLKLEEQGWSSGYYIKPNPKITVTSLFKGFWQMQDKGENCLRLWSLHTGMEVDQVLSKQAIDYRMNHRTLELVEQVLKHTLQLKLNEHFLEQAADENIKFLVGKFRNVLLQDSTMQSLPVSVKDLYKAGNTQNKEMGMLRLQCVYNFTTQTWVDFKLGGFTNNDQSEAMMITKTAQKRDLILRDLGYCTLKSLAQLVKNQFVVTPWDKKSNMYDPITKEHLPLLELFKGKQEIDQAILLGRKQQLPMRLVATKLPKAVVEKRIKSAKAKQTSSSNHSEEYYELLGWDIFLTNVDNVTLNPKQIGQLYGLRWYIEILFKAWKSHANFTTMLGQKKMCYHRTIISIYLLLIRFVYCSLDIYHYIQEKVKEQTDSFISIMKFHDVCKSLSAIILSISSLSDLDYLIPYFVKHATYEKRNQRLNMRQKYLYFKELQI